MKQIFYRLVVRATGQEYIRELSRAPIAGEVIEVRCDKAILSLHVELVTHTPDDRYAARVNVITGQARCVE